MQTRFLITAIFGLFSAVLGSPTPQSVAFTSANAPNPFLQCSSVGLGCHMDMTLNTQAPYQQRWSCTCDDNAQKKPDLAWFYTEKDYWGYEYRSYGDYGICYNVPESFDKKSKSFASNLPNTQPIICCVYTTWFCDESLYWIQVDGTNEDGAIAELKGPLQNSISSFRCSKWVDAESNCHGTGPGQQ